MRIDSPLFTFYFFYAKFFFRLSNPELICGKLSSTNAIEKVLFIAYAFFIFNSAYPDAALKALISCILKDAKHGAAHASVFGCSTQFAVGIFDPCAKKKTPLFFTEPVLAFLPICLDSKVCLRTSDLRFRRVAVHCDQVTGIPAQLPVFSF
jgi:hypothetical protein